MSLEEINGNSADRKRSALLGFNKLDRVVPDGGPKDLIISTPEDFAKAERIARIYVGNCSTDQSSLEIFEWLGTQIDLDYPFIDQGMGVNTLAGQLRDSRVENRDCKLPTFLLGLAQQEFNPALLPMMIFLKSNPAHPYIRIKIDDKTYFGHFTKPNLEVGQTTSSFGLLTAQHGDDLKRFIDQGRTYNFSIDFQGMQSVDRLFLQI